MTEGRKIAETGQGKSITVTHDGHSTTYRDHPDKKTAVYDEGNAYRVVRKGSFRTTEERLPKWNTSVRQSTADLGPLGPLLVVVLLIAFLAKMCGF